MVKNEYIKVVRKGKRNFRLELKNHETIQVPVEGMDSWVLVPDENGVLHDGKEKIREQYKKRDQYYTNGLGVLHPYEIINMDVTQVEYEEGIFTPF